MDAGGLLFLFLFWLAVVDAATHLVTMVVAVATAVVAATMVADANNPKFERWATTSLFLC